MLTFELISLKLSLFFSKHEFIFESILAEMNYMLRKFCNDRYFALELCTSTLADYCGGRYRGPMPEPIEALTQMASGLAYIHQQRLVHGEIGPCNVLISSPDPCNDPEVTLKIADFGLAKPAWILNQK